MVKTKRFMLGLVAFLCLAGSAAADETRPFDAGANAGVVSRLHEGTTIERSTFGGPALGADDWARMAELGFDHGSAAVVRMHYVPRTDPDRQIGRLRTLSHALEGFLPSGACDRIAPAGDGRAVCTGTVAGPLGSVPVRMTVAAKLERAADGAVHLSLHNVRPLEAKAVFSWMTLAEPDRLKVAIDLYPSEGGWLVYTRIGIAMSAERGSAKLVSDALVKLDTWLCADLARA